MTKHEVAQLIARLKITYPKFFISADKEEIQLQINTWHEHFADIQAVLVIEAVKALTDALKFPPTIADIKEKLALILQPKALSEIEAWQLVRKAVDEYTCYDSLDSYDGTEKSIISASSVNKKAFDKLPHVIRRIVGSINQLREWQSMDRGVFNSVVQSNVMRSYTNIVKHEAELAMLPESTRALMAQIDGARQRQIEGG
jgi:hypothetical protein